MDNEGSDFAGARHRGIAMVAGGSPQRQAELAALVRFYGYTPIALSADGAADFLLLDLCSETEPLRDSLSEIGEYLERHHSVALVWTDMDGLEDAYAALPSGQTHFLVDASDVQAMPILAGAYGRDAMNRLHDRNREVEFGSLHRISDELAEFARTLAGLADPERLSNGSDRSASFRPAPVGGFQALPDNAGGTGRIDARALRDIIRARRLRDRFFDRDLFADPAWDILLDLKAAGIEGRRVSVSSLCIAAAVPPTTALRWITAMTESGMLIREQDPDDARRVFILLSDETSAKIDDYFTAADMGAGKAI
jgi:DNA-binding MarR family transcriptional regulator